MRTFLPLSHAFYSLSPPLSVLPQTLFTFSRCSPSGVVLFLSPDAILPLTLSTRSTSCPGFTLSDSLYLEGHSTLVLVIVHLEQTTNVKMSKNSQLENDAGCLPNGKDGCFKVQCRSIEVPTVGNGTAIAPENICQRRTIVSRMGERGGLRS